MVAENELANGHPLPCPRILFDATFPPELPAEQLPTIIDFTHGWPDDVQHKVLERWDEYGITRRPTR